LKQNSSQGERGYPIAVAIFRDDSILHYARQSSFFESGFLHSGDYSGKHIKQIIFISLSDCVGYLIIDTYF
jgi:hypothetical protein